MPITLCSAVESLNACFYSHRRVRSKSYRAHALRSSALLALHVQSFGNCTRA